jgi:hypothetical protein
MTVTLLLGPRGGGKSTRAKTLALSYPRQLVFCPANHRTTYQTEIPSACIVTKEKTFVAIL